MEVSGAFQSSLDRLQCGMAAFQRASLKPPLVRMAHAPDLSASRALNDGREGKTLRRPPGGLKGSCDLTSQVIRHDAVYCFRVHA